MSTARIALTCFAPSVYEPAEANKPWQRLRHRPYVLLLLLRTRLRSSTRLRLTLLDCCRLVRALLSFPSSTHELRSSNPQSASKSAAALDTSSPPSRCCCACGCVPLVLAQPHTPQAAHATCFATDVNPHAATATRSTLAQHSLAAAVVVSDLVSGLQSRLAGCVDVFLFNPPYVPSPPEEVRCAAPGLALALGLMLLAPGWRRAPVCGLGWGLARARSHRPPPASRA